MDANKKDEEIQKLKAELQQIKEANSNQFGGHLMMQIGIQIGEKFGELKKEMDGLKSANRVEIGAFDELKEEFGKLNEENTGLKEKMAKINKEFDGKQVKMDEMEKKIKEVEAKNAELEGQIAEKNGEMAKIKSEKDEEKAKLEGLKAEMDKMKTAFDEKIVEFEAKMRESLEQKADKKELANLTEKIDGMGFIQLKNNKWNPVDCGPKMAISERGLVVKHSGEYEYNCIRAILPIPFFNLNFKKPSIAGYFEVQIITQEGWIDIGFCMQQFPLERKWLGDKENSIGICKKAGMYIDGQFKKFGNNDNGFFNAGDVVGVGILHFPANKWMKCFATCNGQLLGTIKLPKKFVHLQLFPAATSYYTGASFHANFGQETWKFDASQLLK